MQCLKIFLLSLAIDIYQPVLTIWDRKMKVWKYLKIALEEISGKSIAIYKKGMHYAQWRNRHFSPFWSVAVVQMRVSFCQRISWLKSRCVSSKYNAQRSSNTASRGTATCSWSLLCFNFSLRMRRIPRLKSSIAMFDRKFGFFSAFR